MLVKWYVISDRSELIDTGNRITLGADKSVDGDYHWAELDKQQSDPTHYMVQVTAYHSKSGIETTCEYSSI